MLIDSLIQWFQAGLNSSSLAMSAAYVLLYAILVLILVSVYGYVIGWLERKIIARIQHRHGPTYVGKYGIFQNLADIIKLLSKEILVPENADRTFLWLAPVTMVALVLFVLLLLPFSASLQATSFGLGLLIIFVLIGFSPMLLFIAGFASGNKLSEIGAQRSVLAMISFEIPMIIVIAGVALAAHSFSIGAIVSAQNSLPFIVLLPIGFIVFFITMLAELERPPFDVREADSELIAGWLTDFSGPYYAVALMLDYFRMFMGSLIIALLFLGGWSGPILPGIVWLLLKTFAVSLFIIIIRATTFRMRIDRILRTGWLYLLPLSLINLLLAFILLK